MIPRLIDRFSLTDDGWIRAFPVGEFKRDGRTIKLTPDRIQRIAKNFKAGRPRYCPNINVEHKDGAVGWVEDMEARQDGLYVKPDGKAREFLGSGQFRYVSPEIVWEGWEDAETGDRYDDVMVGLAATNHPFFGEDVALFSAREDFMMPSPAMIEKNEELYGMMNLMQTLGSACDEHGDDPEMGQALQTARDAVKRKMGRMVGEYKDGAARRSEEFKTMPQDVTTEVGELAKLVKQLKKFFSPQEAEEIAEAAEDAADKPSKTDKASGQRGEVYNVNVNGVDAEQFAALEAKLQAQAEAFAAVKAENERLSQAVAAEQYRASLAEMERFCAQFGALSTGTDFAKRMLDYKTKLSAEEFAALVSTLQGANTAAASGDLFTRRGANAGVERSAHDQFDAKVKAYMAEHKVGYDTAFTAVGAQEPALYREVMGR